MKIQFKPLSSSVAMTACHEGEVNTLHLAALLPARKHLSMVCSG